MKQTSPIDTSSPASFFWAEVLMIVGQARPPNRSEVVSLLGSQPIRRTFLPCWAIMYERFARVKLLPIPPLP
ncbi:MAG: hypothetical protein U0270_11495 [Labilithrix sp.]